MSVLFFSYSHSDEAMRDELEKHLSMLKRQGLVQTFHDRKILPGEDFAHSIDEGISRADIILLLVSSDFLNSHYCYSIEFGLALERHRKGDARIIPIILRHCDWMHPPLGDLLAVPTDGKPLAAWSDKDDGFLDIVKQIRKALEMPALRSTDHSQIRDRRRESAEPRSQNVTFARKLTVADIERLLYDSFEFMATFFQNSLLAVQKENSAIQANFRRIDANSFTAKIHEGDLRSTKCKIFLSQMFGNGICYSNDLFSSNSINECLRGEDINREFRLKPTFDFFQANGRHFSAAEAAEFYWSLFIKNFH